uniref:Uncharacterized protein n=1 Tax=Panagrellus redivivus TaxID=6233 RepID=A0A7E4VRM3_PANRE
MVGGEEISHTTKQQLHMHQAIVTTRERANDSLTTRESVLSPRKVRVCDAACAFLMELAMGGDNIVTTVNLLEDY